MAIRIPRAGVVEAAPLAKPETVATDTREMKMAGDALANIGTEMRKAQSKLDVSEAETHILTAKRVAAAKAAEEGLYGEEYTAFMGNATAAARKEVAGLTSLPEVRRYLSNEGRIKQEADRIQYEAEGRRLELENTQARINNNMEVMGVAAESDFFMDGSELKPELFELMGNARLAAESLPFQPEDVTAQNSLNASSRIGLRAGMEIIKGFTRNGNGKPWELLQILNNENHEFTSNMTEQDVWTLKQMAQQEMARVASARTTQKEAYTERLDEWNKNAEKKIKNFEFISQDEFDEALRLYERIENTWKVDAQYEQWPGDYQIDPDKQERAREVQRTFLEMKAMHDAADDANGMAGPELDVRVAALEQQAKQQIMAGETAMDDAVIGEDGEVQTGELMQTRMRLSAYKAAQKRRKEAQDRGNTVHDYIVHVDGPAPAAIEIGFSSPELALEVIDIRADYVGGASNYSGYPATLLSAAESKSLIGEFKSGNLTDQYMTAVFGKISMLPTDSQKAQVRMFGAENESWARGMLFAVQTGNPGIYEPMARGAAIVAAGGDEAEIFWSTDGEEKAVRQAVNTPLLNTFVSYPQVAQDLTQAAMLYGIGSAPKTTGNSASDDAFKAEALLSGLFPNGAIIQDEKVWPNPTSDMVKYDMPPVTMPDVLSMIEAEDFNGYVLPKLDLGDEVDDDLMGMTGAERLAYQISTMDEDLILEPDPGRPGWVYVKSGNPANAQFVNERGMFMDANGRPLALNLNEFRERRQFLQQAPESERAKRGVESYFEGDVFVVPGEQMSRVEEAVEVRKRRKMLEQRQQRGE